MPCHMQATDAVFALLEHLDGFVRLALAVPQPDRSIKTAYSSTDQPAPTILQATIVVII